MEAGKLEDMREGMGEEEGRGGRGEGDEGGTVEGFWYGAMLRDFVCVSWTCD